MILNQRDDALLQAREVARAMMTAARTAPKSRGNDLLEVAAVTGDDIVALSNEMARLYEETQRPVYDRDGKNIHKAQVIVLIGIRPQPMGLNCGHCGFPTCVAKPAQAPCAFNTIDAGIAIGAACAAAADHRVDTRVMYSVGMAALKLNILSGCISVMGIPVSISSKSPFFDR